MKIKKILPEIQELSEQVGEFIQYWGFKKIHGRIWVYLYLSDHPIDAAEIMRRTKISKALASMSLRDLLNYEVIEDVGKSERGTTLYQANPDVTAVILNVLRRREKKMLATISTAHLMVNQLPPREKEDSAISQARIQKLGDLIKMAEMGLDGILQLNTVDFEMMSQFNERSSSELTR